MKNVVEWYLDRQPKTLPELALKVALLPVAFVVGLLVLAAAGLLIVLTLPLQLARLLWR